MNTSFKAGVGREIVTPPLGTLLYGYPMLRPAESVHDDLYVTAFAFQKGEKRVIMISADICAHGIEESELTRKLVSEATGVPISNITFSATHTHSGPCTRKSVGWGDKDEKFINEILNPMTVKAAVSAVQNMKDAVMGVGVIESDVGINRRQRTLNGDIILGQNPWGIFNKSMTVISFKDTSGNHIGCMIHYGAHCTSAGPNKEITRDWAGGTCDAIEREFGVVAAFFSGPTGDAGPNLPNARTVGNIKQTEILASLAGIDAVKAFRTIKQYSEPEFDFICDSIRLPFMPLMSYEEAKKKLVAIGNLENATGAQQKAAAKYRDVMAVYEENLEIKDALTYDVLTVSLGPVAFCHFPFEVFSEIAIRIAHHSPYRHTLILNNTNGALAYFPTKSEIPLGGYEVFMFEHFQTYNLPDDSDTAAVKEYIRVLNKLYEKSKTDV